MNKIVSIKINAVFLATVLVLGTIATISPSFMVGAHAQQYGMDQKYNSYEPDYGMDSYDDKQSYGKDSNSYDKSKDSSIIVKKIKCNNINVNVNGFNGVEVGTLPTALNGLVTDDEAQASADEGEIGASSFGSDGVSDGGRPSGSDNDSRFVCIDNNDFVVVEEEEEEPISELCEECFSENSMLQSTLIDILSSGIGFATNFFTEDNEGQVISEVIASGGQINTLEKLCNEIENAAKFLGVPLSDEIVRTHLLFIIEIGTGSSAGFEDSIDELVECLLEKGLIVDREEFEPDSISANGIAGTNQCIGDPLCARLQ